MNWLLADNQNTTRDVVALVWDGGFTTEVVDHLVYSAFGSIVSQSDSDNENGTSPILFGTTFAPEAHPALVVLRHGLLRG